MLRLIDCGNVYIWTHHVYNFFGCTLVALQLIWWRWDLVFYLGIGIARFHMIYYHIIFYQTTEWQIHGETELVSSLSKTFNGFTFAIIVVRARQARTELDGMAWRLVSCDLWGIFPENYSKKSQKSTAVSSVEWSYLYRNRFHQWNRVWNSQAIGWIGGMCHYGSKNPTASHKSQLNPKVAEPQVRYICLKHRCHGA